MSRGVLRVSRHLRQTRPARRSVVRGDDLRDAVTRRCRRAARDRRGGRCGCGRTRPRARADPRGVPRQSDAAANRRARAGSGGAPDRWVCVRRCCVSRRTARRPCRSSTCCSVTPSARRRGAGAGRSRRRGDDDPDSAPRDAAVGGGGGRGACGPARRGRAHHRETGSAARTVARGGQLSGVRVRAGAARRRRRRRRCARRIGGSSSPSMRRLTCEWGDA